MKVLVSILLFLFLSFLMAPTVISLVKDDADTSMAYSVTEEEIQKEIKEIKEVKAQPGYEFAILLFSGYTVTSKIVSENLQKHDNISREIFSPPPETI